MLIIHSLTAPNVCISQKRKRKESMYPNKIYIVPVYEKNIYSKINDEVPSHS